MSLCIRHGEHISGAVIAVSRHIAHCVRFGRRVSVFVVCIADGVSHWVGLFEDIAVLIVNVACHVAVSVGDAFLTSVNIVVVLYLISVCIDGLDKPAAVIVNVS